MKEETLREFLETYFAIEDQDTEMNLVIQKNNTTVNDRIFYRADYYYEGFAQACHPTLRTELEYFIFEGWIIVLNWDSWDTIEFDLEDRDIDEFIKFIKYHYPELLTD